MDELYLDVRLEFTKAKCREVFCNHQGQCMLGKHASTCQGPQHNSNISRRNIRKVVASTFRKTAAADRATIINTTDHSEKTRCFCMPSMTRKKDSQMVYHLIEKRLTCFDCFPLLLKCCPMSQSCISVPKEYRKTLHRKVFFLHEHCVSVNVSFYKKLIIYLSLV